MSEAFEWAPVNGLLVAEPLEDLVGRAVRP